MPEEEKVYTSMYSRNAELYHHGILGMKWGLRNGPPYPLGSDISTGSRLKKIFSKKELTEEEIKKRQEEKDRIANAKAAKKLEKEEKKEAKRETVTSSAIKKAKGMTDEELKAVINRLNMEKQYANLEKDLVELSRKNPTLSQKVKNYIVNETKKQLIKTRDTVVNSITQEVNKEISKKVKEVIGSKTKEKESKDKGSTDKKDEPKDKKEEPPKDKKEDSPKESIIDTALKETKDIFTKAWTDSINYDYETPDVEPRMSRKDKKRAESAQKELAYREAVAESYRQMYDDPDFENNRDTIWRQFAQATSRADDFRKENKDLLDEYDRQNKKRK